MAARNLSVIKPCKWLYDHAHHTVVYHVHNTTELAGSKEIRMKYSERLNGSDLGGCLKA